MWHTIPLCQYPHRRDTNIYKKSMLLKNNDTQTTQQIITLMRIVLSQNYFTFRNKIYQPEKGVSMRWPISSTTAEIFLKYLEDMHIQQHFDAKNIVFYTRHVDDIVIIYNTERTHPDLISTHINQIHTHIQNSILPAKTTDAFVSLSFLVL